MKVRFIIKEQEENIPSPAAVKTDDELVSSIQDVLRNLGGAQLAALEKYAMALRDGASLAEKKMTKPEKEKREKYVKGMKSSKKDFEKRYGKDAEDVMYATATKMALKKKKK